VALLLPVTTHAQTDPVLSTDMHISIDSFVWTVYTRAVAFGDFGIGEPEIPHEKIYNFPVIYRIVAAQSALKWCFIFETLCEGGLSAPKFVAL
jgi:hypothetical protein